MASVNTGSNPDFKSKMPDTTDVASIQDAIRHLLYGGSNSAGAIVNSNNTTPGALTNTDGSHGLVGHLNSLKTSLTNSSIQKSYLTGKGQLITATASGVPALLNPGTDPSVGNDFVLRANSAAASGLDWFNISTSYLPKTAGASHPLTGNLLVNGVGGSNDTELRVTSNATRYSALRLQEGSVNMWSVAKETNKNFAVWGHKTDGSYRDSPIYIDQQWADAAGVTGWGGVRANLVTKLYDGGASNIFISDSSAPPSNTMYLLGPGSGVTQQVFLENSNLPAGTTYHFWLNGFGGVARVVAGANVVVQSAGNMSYLRTNYSVVTAVKRLDGATDYWMLFGDLRS